MKAASDGNVHGEIQYLDTQKKGPAAEELAEQLQVVLDLGLKVDLDRISRKREGDIQDESRTTREKIGAIDTSAGKLEILLLRIMDIIAEGGTGVAFPSQTTYLAKDAPLDPQKKEEEATRVRQWRERGELPFPDFRPEQVGDMRDRIEFPPPGSSLRSDRGGLRGKAPDSER